MEASNGLTGFHAKLARRGRWTINRATKSRLAGKIATGPARTASLAVYIALSLALSLGRLQSLRLGLRRSLEDAVRLDYLGNGHRHRRRRRRRLERVTLSMASGKGKERRARPIKLALCSRHRNFQ